MAADLRSTPAPQASDALVDVIVPVLCRPHRVAPLVESLRASTDRARLVFVPEFDDAEEIAAIAAAGADAFAHPRAHTFAQKVNFAYTLTERPWLFLTGDDVAFRPGWFEAAMRCHDRTGASVVGTNDLASQHVMAGVRAVHMLIRRSYVEEVGASWDGPGVVCHQGYFHGCVDDEIVVAASRRATFSPCLDSVVEHLHWANRKAELDDAYRLGMVHQAVDMATFSRRETPLPENAIVVGAAHPGIGASRVTLSVFHAPIRALTLDEATATMTAWRGATVPVELWEGGPVLGPTDVDRMAFLIGHALDALAQGPVRGSFWWEGFTATTAQRPPTTYERFTFAR
jgi:hypothetical protein